MSSRPGFFWEIRKVIIVMLSKNWYKTALHEQQPREVDPELIRFSKAFSGLVHISVFQKILHNTETGD